MGKGKVPTLHHKRSGELLPVSNKGHDRCALRAIMPPFAQRQKKKERKKRRKSKPLPIVPKKEKYRLKNQRFTEGQGPPD